MSRWWPVWLLLWASPLLAEDFSPQDPGWTGLTQLVEMARTVKVELEVRPRLDWSTVDEQTILLVVAPAVAPSGEARANLERFVQSGGRLVLADDFGAGDGWLQPFGLTLEPKPGTTAQVYDDVAALPMVSVDPEPRDEELAQRWTSVRAKVSPGQFLAHSLHGPIVLNHPASLRWTPQAQDRTVVWGHFREPGLAWLAEVQSEAGRILALSDPSAFINGVLDRVHDNKQFAANLMRYYCVQGRPCRVMLLAGLRDITGTFHPREDPDRRASFRSVLEQLDTWLRQLADGLNGPLGKLTCVALVLALLAWPVVRLSRSRPPLLPPDLHEAQHEGVLRASVQAWLASPTADFRRPARLLATHLQRLLAGLDLEPEASRPRLAERPTRQPATGFALAPQAIDRLERSGRCHPQAAARLRQVFGNLQEVAQDDTRVMYRAEFARLAADVEWAEALLQHTAQHARQGPTAHLQG